MVQVRRRPSGFTAVRSAPVPELRCFGHCEFTFLGPFERVERIRQFRHSGVRRTVVIAVSHEFSHTKAHVGGDEYNRHTFAQLLHARLLHLRTAGWEKSLQPTEHCLDGLVGAPAHGCSGHTQGGPRDQSSIEPSQTFLSVNKSHGCEEV